jgi:predicted transcriptional regulator
LERDSKFGNVIQKRKLIYIQALLQVAMEKKEILAKLIDEKKAAILRTLLNSTDEMYLKEIAQKSNVPITSTFRILHELVNLDILKRRIWKTSKVYSCQENKKVEFLQELFHEEFDGVNEFVNLVSPIEQIENIIMHGSRKKGKANVLLLGQNIPSEALETACNQLKEKEFEISYLTLTKAQYAQMAKMGLYAGEKKVLK